jgi:hypothetical protein
MASASESLGGVSVKTGDYTAVRGDSGKLLVMNSGSAHTITLPSSPPSPTWVIAIQNAGAGMLIVSRRGLTIHTAASDLSVTTGQGTLIWCDGSNYFTERGLGSPPTLTTKGGFLTYSTALDRYAHMIGLAILSETPHHDRWPRVEQCPCRCTCDLCDCGCNERRLADCSNPSVQQQLRDDRAQPPPRLVWRDLFDLQRAADHATDSGHLFELG